MSGTSLLQLGLLGGGLLVLVCLPLINRWLPRQVCDRLGWHLPPKQYGFDGCSLTGTCPRCGKSVLQDSQGNWF